MHQQEQARLDVLNSVLAEEITIGQAAALMDLSERHARRLLAAYREVGAEALAHGNRNRRPHNAVPEAVAAAVVRLAATRYPGANHTHLSELLEEHAGLPTVRRILTRAGMPSPRRRRPPQHRVRRERMPRAGMRCPVCNPSAPRWQRGRHHVYRAVAPVCQLGLERTTPSCPANVFARLRDGNPGSVVMKNAFVVNARVSTLPGSMPFVAKKALMRV